MDKTFARTKRETNEISGYDIASSIGSPAARSNKPCDWIVANPKFARLSADQRMQLRFVPQRMHSEFIFDDEIPPFFVHESSFFLERGSQKFSDTTGINPREESRVHGRSNRTTLSRSEKSPNRRYPNARLKKEELGVPSRG